ncbi:hypothetical protein HDU98_007285, partial [Podochytrium sp. JEL0797]
MSTTKLNDSNKHAAFPEFEERIKDEFLNSKVNLSPTHFRCINNVDVNSKVVFIENNVEAPLKTDPYYMSKPVTTAAGVTKVFNNEQFGVNRGEWDEANIKFKGALLKHVEAGVIERVCKSATIFGKLEQLRTWANFDAGFKINALVTKINNLRQGTKQIVTHKDDTQAILSELERLGHNKNEDAAVVNAFAIKVAITFKNSCVDADLRDKFNALKSFEEMAAKIMSIQRDAETAALQQGMDVVDAGGRAHQAVEGMEGGTPFEIALLKRIEVLSKAMAVLKSKGEVEVSGGGGESKRKGCDVFLAHVAGGVTDGDLFTLFKPYGVVSAVVNHSTSGPMGIGFVILEELDKADKIRRAVAALNGVELKGGKLVVKVSNDNKARSNYSSHLSTHTGAALSAKRLLDVNIDSGTTKSIVTEVDMLSEVRSVKPTQFLTASGHVMEGPGLEGSVNGTAGGTKTLSVKGAEFIPSAADNLLSVSDLADQKLSVWFDAADLSVNIGTMDPDAKHEIVAKGFRKDKQYRIEIEVEDAVTSESAHGEAGSVEDVEREVDALACLGKGIPSKLDWGAWHERFGHVNCGAIARTVGHVHGLKIRGEVPGDFVCESCLVGKMHRMRSDPSHERTGGVLANISMDLMFPGSEEGAGE